VPTVTTNKGNQLDPIKGWQELNKLFGNKMFRGDEAAKFDTPTIPFPSPSLADASHYGGIPYGKISQFHGPEGCLDSDTFVNYKITTQEGKVINKKGGTIENLYNRFHRIKEDGKGRGKSHLLDPTVIFSAPSVNSENRIFHNEILDVVKTGRKKCLLIKTKEQQIVATEDHKFWTGEKFVPAGSLEVGDKVHVHDNSRFKVNKKYPNRYIELSVKNHPNGRIKKVFCKKTKKEYIYYRVRRSRAVVEAYRNGLSLTKYLNKLNSNDLKGLLFLDEGVHIHHVDENCKNDHIDNLAIIDPKSHNRHYALEQHNNLRFISIETEIVEIYDAGERDTYDIKMAFPENNYVANGFVVHNSGKTFMAMLMVREVLDSDPTAEVAWFDCESSFDKKWAKAIGIDMSRFHYIEENVGANVFSMICGRPSATGKGKGSPGILDQNRIGILNVKLIVIDSIAAIIPPAELDRQMEELEMAALARFLPKALRVTSAKLAQTDTALLCINHAKEAFGDNVNKYTYPGGRGLRYMLSLVVLFDTTQSKSATLWDKDELKCGHRVDCTVEKTRGGPNKWKAKVWFNFVEGQVAKLGEEVALLGEAYGIVTRPNKMRWVYKANEITGADNFFEFLDDNPDIVDDIIKECQEIKERGGTRNPDLLEESATVEEINNDSN
jgi:RecA/RadA recombinase